jgi:hypothetical protein
VGGVACKDDKDAALQRAVTDHSQILCDHIFSCCNTAEIAQMAFVDDKKPADHDGCVALHTRTGQGYIADTDAEEAAGRVALHVDQSDACAAETRGLNCADFHARLVKVHLEDAFALCNSAIVEPLVANGGQCKLYFDCQSGYCDAPVSGKADGGAEVLGTCKPLPSAGQPCPGAVCADGLRCDPKTTTCTKLVATNGACQQDDECVSGSCPAGKCITPGRCGG